MSQHIDIAVNLLSSRLVADIDTIIHNAAEKNVSPLIVIGSAVTSATIAKAMSVAPMPVVSDRAMARGRAGQSKTA